MRMFVALPVDVLVNYPVLAAQKTAGEILDSVLDDGQEELSRASTGLAFSGFAGGLNISFGAVTLGVVGAVTGGSVGLSAMPLYPIGFLIVIIGRSQLFTENTITPVSVVLTEFNVLPNMLWLWAVVFVANVLDTIVFAAALVYGDVFTTRGL
jgi:formate-nitrite transporter family protein